MASNKNTQGQTGTAGENSPKKSRSGSHKPKSTGVRNATATPISGIQWSPDLIQVALDLAISQFMGSAARANRTGVTLGTTNVFELYAWNFNRCSQEYRGRGMNSLQGATSAMGGGTLGDDQQSTTTPGQPILGEQSRTAAAGR